MDIRYDNDNVRIKRFKFCVRTMRLRFFVPPVSTS